MSLILTLFLVDSCSRHAFESVIFAEISPTYGGLAKLSLPVQTD